ncbi:MAG: NAD(P)H-binding protein, partial [Cytophagaceae bacterium]|nr:NAD(P)H-binding protein [Gemmatimonadaceae bacterium]
VVAAVRRPETVTGATRTAKINLSDHASLVAALSGVDVVVGCLGHGGLKDSAKPTTLYSDSTRALRAAMRETGTRRIFVLSSGGTVQDDAAPWFYTKLLRRYLINNYLDAARMETIFKIHAVDVSKFIAEEIDNRAWIAKHPVLGYPK